MEGIVSSIITGGLALVGIIISTIASNRKIQSNFEKNQAVTDCKLDELTREVREHNNFAMKIPVIENRLDAVERRLNAIEEQFKRAGD